MSEPYLIERAESCRRLACEETDADLRNALHFLAEDYRAKARMALKRRKSSTPH